MLLDWDFLFCCFEDWRRRWEGFFRVGEGNGWVFVDFTIENSDSEDYDFHLLNMIFFFFSQNILLSIWLFTQTPPYFQPSLFLKKMKKK